MQRFCLYQQNNRGKICNQLIFLLHFPLNPQFYIPQ